MLTLSIASIPTPIGPLAIVAADDIVRAGGFTEDVDGLLGRLGPELRAAPRRVVGDLGRISDAIGQYFGGQLTALDSLAVEQPGGRFKQDVWAALREIPPGRPATYLQLAQALGGGRLARAVGMACATNLISPLVPCHRVTRTGGALAGYYWGLERKRWLLAHEQRHAAGVLARGGPSSPLPA